MAMYDLFLSIGIVVVVICGIHLIVEHIRKRKRRKSVLQKKVINKRFTMLCQYSDQRLRLNTMALEAVREMSAAAAKKTTEKPR